MTAEVVRLPVRPRPQGRPRSGGIFRPGCEKDGYAALDYLGASTTIGLFREAAATAGWALPPDPYAAAIALCARLTSAAAQIAKARDILGFAKPDPLPPRDPPPRRPPRKPKPAA